MSRTNRIVNEDIVESRLRRFINKYYRIKIFQGLAVTVSVAVVLLFVLVVLGNTFQAGRGLRNILNITAGVIGVGVVAWFILKPIGQRLGWIRGLNFKDASRIIQQKHGSIEDRIINIVELTREKAGQNNLLYDFAIAQKTDNIREFNFDEAISFRKLGLFLIRLALLVVMGAAAILLWPDFVRRGMGHMWSGNEMIAGLERVNFTILNDSLEVESGKDFLLRFAVSAEFPTEKADVKMGSTADKATRVADGFEYLFKAVNSSITFRLECNGAVSGEYVLKTLKKPEIGNIRLKVIPPGYTGLTSTIIDGDGNAEVPLGSKLIWTIRTVNTDGIYFRNETDSVSLSGGGNNWEYEKSISNNFNYEIVCLNNNGLFTNYIYKISVVRDLFPSIDISESRDSTITDEVYVQGIIQDDYGFSKLELVEDKSGKETNKEIKIDGSNLYEKFYYTLVADSTSTSYFFRVWDNDRVNGPKFTESRRITLRTISKAEVENINTQLVDSIKSSMTDVMSTIDLMQKKMSEFRMDQLVSDLKPYEIQEKLKELNDLKKQVVDFLNNITKTDKEFTENEDFLNEDKEFTEKAKQIQDLMESLLDDEMKDLLQQFEDLAKEFNAKKVDEVTEKMEANMEKLKEQMDMSLELLKKYDMEKDLIKQAEKLDQLADSLQADSPKMDENGNNLKEEFKKWEQEYEKNLKQDQEFKKPMGLDKMEKEREEVRKAAEDLEKKESGNEKPSKEDKKSAAESLKKLAKKMKDKLGAMSGESEFVDLEDLRQIRNSLNDFSKKQEEINGRILKLNTISPTFTAVIKEQKELQDKFKSISDSLKSIGYKQPMITRVVGDELFHVETSMKNLFNSYSRNNASVVRLEQNKIMSETNSIAVKLDELISSMQDAKGTGEGNKGFTDRKKPKPADESGSEKMGKAKSMQESMKEQLKSAIQKMKSGANGKKERGEMARMLGQREMMRKALEKALQDGGLGTEAKEKANEALNMMKEVEKDIIYNRLNDQTLDKDNLIRTKLLDAENAEKERENENRRESKEFRGSFDPYRKELEKGVDPNKDLEQLLKYNELKLKRFYQEKYLKYIESTKK